MGISKPMSTRKRGAETRHDAGWPPGDVWATLGGIMSRSRPPRRPASGAPNRTQSASGQSASGHSPSGHGGSAGRGRPAALLYGLHPVAAAWTNPGRKCRRLLATAGAMEALQAAIVQAAALGLNRPVPETVERAELDRLLPGAVHQGVALDAAPLPERTLDDICRQGEARARDIVIVLDQVTDPHNVGAILRSAAAFGASAVVLPERNAPEVTGVLAKSASGALEVVPLVRIVNLARSLGELQQAGFWCVGLDEDGRRTLAEIDLKGKVAIVLGAEGEGLRRLTRERCDDIARLPTGGPVASLNVSNAAAVALYELVRAG